MHNIFLFARREYLETVRKKSFIVMTILLPAMMFGFTVLPSMIASKHSGEMQHIVIATSDAQFANDIRDQFSKPHAESTSRRGKASDSTTRGFHVQIDANVSPQEEEALTQKVNSHEIDGYLWAPPESLTDRQFTYRSRNSGDLDTVGTLSSAVRHALLQQSLRKHGASAQEIED